MGTNFKTIENEARFQQELTSAGTKLVVADFFATWCGPCTRIAPVFLELSAKYPNAVFLKIDVDQCEETTLKQGVTVMPTFILYRSKVKLETLTGANPTKLEEKIVHYYGGDSEDGGAGGEESLVKGHMDLCTFINKAGCECLNESDDHPLAHALTTKGGYLESDVDEQLIVNLEFSQPVKLHSLKLTGPESNGPKNIKLFINQPKTLDFDSAEAMGAIQSFQLSGEDLKENSLIPLYYVKYQNVQNISIFVKDNQSGAETTQIDYLGLIGSPVQATNMSDFKRVAGKKGESH